MSQPNLGIPTQTESEGPPLNTIRSGEGWLGVRRERAAIPIRKCISFSGVFQEPAQTEIRCGSRQYAVTTPNNEDRQSGEAPSEVSEGSVQPEVAFSSPGEEEQQASTIISDSDVIIAVVGPSGTGKSSFIAAATGRRDIPIGDGLGSCTTELKIINYKCPFKSGLGFVFVDTPGSDTEAQDGKEILDMIANWLRKKCKQGRILAGILYFHRISDNRLTDTSNPSYQKLQELCGENAFKSIILITTMWGETDSGTEKAHEVILDSNYWRPMITRGSTMKRFDNTHQSAWDILDPITQAPKSFSKQNRKKTFASSRAQLLWEKIGWPKVVKTTSPLDDQVIIIVMGQTGAGRSSFIAAATGRNDVAVGHNLESCTTEVKIIKVKYECFDKSDFGVVFVETPGFNNSTMLPDVEIMGMTTAWLNKSYGQKVILAGILYLHPVSDARMVGTPIKNLLTFRESVFGTIPYKNIVFTTTMWASVEQNVGEEREDRVMLDYWGAMAKEGSTTRRFLGTRESAWSVLDHFVREANKHHASLVKEELSEIKKQFLATVAERKIYLKLEALVTKQQETLAEIRRKDNQSADSARLEALKSSYNDRRKELAVVYLDMESLKPPLGKHLLRLIWGPGFGL